jgi:hypothetical protein
MASRPLARLPWIAKPSFGDLMTEHVPSGAAEVGAPMDYPQHRRTYASFVSLIKIGALAIIATLQALALFGLAANGFWFGVLMIVLMVVASAIGFRNRGSIVPLVVVIVLGFLFMALTL